MKITRYILPLALTLLIASCHTNMKYRSGIYQGEAAHSLPQGYGTLKTKRMTYQGFWNEGRENGQGTLSWGAYTYRGGLRRTDLQGQYRLFGAMEARQEIRERHHPRFLREEDLRELVCGQPGKWHALRCRRHLRGATYEERRGGRARKLLRFRREILRRRMEK